MNILYIDIQRIAHIYFFLDTVYTKCQFLSLHSYQNSLHGVVSSHPLPPLPVCSFAKFSWPLCWCFPQLSVVLEAVSNMALAYPPCPTNSSPHQMFIASYCLTLPSHFCVKVIPNHHNKFLLVYICMLQVPFTQSF